MRGDLAKREPQWVREWHEKGVYRGCAPSQGAAEVRLARRPRRTRAATSNIGTAMNKILKDIIVKSRRWPGFDAP